VFCSRNLAISTLLDTALVCIVLYADSIVIMAVCVCHQVVCRYLTKVNMEATSVHVTARTTMHPVVFVRDQLLSIWKFLHTTLRMNRHWL